MIPIALAYAVFGYLIPGFFNTFKPEFPRLISSLSIGLQGVYGPLLSSSANYIFLFIVLGVFIMVTPADLSSSSCPSWWPAAPAAAPATCPSFPAPSSA